MISQNIAERPVNITSIIKKFKSFIKQVYHKSWHKILKRNCIKIITYEKKQAKRTKKYLHLKKEKKMTLENGENLISF